MLGPCAFRPPRRSLTIYFICESLNRTVDHCFTTRARERLWTLVTIDNIGTENAPTKREDSKTCRAARIEMCVTTRRLVRKYLSPPHRKRVSVRSNSRKTFAPHDSTLTESRETTRRIRTIGIDLESNADVRVKRGVGLSEKQTNKRKRGCDGRIGIAIGRSVTVDDTHAST